MDSGMGELVGLLVLMGIFLVAAGLVNAFQRWAYRMVSDGRSEEEDTYARLIAVAARQLGLTRVGPGSTSPPVREVFEGERGGYFVRLEQTANLGWSLRATLSTGGDRNAPPLAIGIAPRDLGRNDSSRADGTSPITGDPEFDRRIRLSGDPALLCATMDQVTRWGVMNFWGDGSLSSGEGRPVVRLDGSLRDLDGVKDRLDQLLAFAGKLFVPTEELEARLAAIVMQDPVFSVRLRVLDVLASRVALHPGSRDTLRAATMGWDPEIRFRAAAGLGDEGLPALEDLVFQPGIREEVATRALSHLARHAPEKFAVRVLTAALHGPDGPRRVEAFLALSRLGRLGEREVLAMLDADLPAMRLAAIATLEGIGTAAAVAPLHAVVAANLLNLEMRDAAQEAIRKIQSRLTGGAPGQVALSPGDGAAGRMSLVPSEGHRGRVSLTADRPVKPAAREH
jgi:hypothetical protein